MPELPEVEAVRARLQGALRGRRIVSVVARPDPIVLGALRPGKLRAALVGAKVRDVRRKGKHLWLELDRRPWPAFHFGMTGDLQLLAADDPQPRFVLFEAHVAGGRRLVYSDPRRFGRIRLLRDPLAEPPISLLGPDPLEEVPDLAWFERTLGRRRAPVKAALLDQSLFAGVGNWIADEVLYQARVDPRRPASSLSRPELASLRRALGTVIRTAVGVGAESLRFPRGWLFHHRWGRRADAFTASGDAISHTTIGGRTTAWVPARQQ
jgi:formamidopyrimidine-DNA glycosylase